MKLILPAQSLYNSDSIDFKELTVKDLKELSQATVQKDYEKIIDIYLRRVSGISDPYDLTLQDLEYIILNDKFSIPDVSLSVDLECPHCKSNISFTIQAQDIKVNDLDPRITSGEVGLKLASGSNIFFKIPRIRDILIAIKSSKNLDSMSLSSLEAIISYLPILLRKEDQKYLSDIEFLTKSDLIKELELRRSDLIDNEFLKPTDIKLLFYVFTTYFSFGLDTLLERKCTECGGSIKFKYSIDSLKETPFRESRDIMESKILFNLGSEDSTIRSGESISDRSSTISETISEEDRGFRKESTDYNIKTHDIGNGASTTKKIRLL